MRRQKGNPILVAQKVGYTNRHKIIVENKSQTNITSTGGPHNPAINTVKKVVVVSSEKSPFSKTTTYSTLFLRLTQHHHHHYFSHMNKETNCFLPFIESYSYVMMEIPFLCEYCQITSWWIVIIVTTIRKSFCCMGELGKCGVVRFAVVILFVHHR